ncbi:hypothetical protein ACH5RR_007054 [Cinchona calisaya]|uniref:Reverse transcriptase zinc-binding domain-containing protein n=1 Tax=Cinchona calisaya TaxID=153742 RepID=A0ABD3AQT8_9GENT
MINEFFCWNENESVNHLFFGCPFSLEECEEVLRSCLVYRIVGDFEQELQWIIVNSSKDKFVGAVRSVALATIIYHLPRWRNSSLFKKKLILASSVVQQVLKDV